MMEGANDDEDLVVLEQIMTDLENAHKELEGKNDHFVESMDSQDEEYEEKTKELEKDMKIIYSELCNARSVIAKQKGKVLEKLNSRSDPGNDVRGRQEISHAMRVKRLDAPRFTGTVRDYPSFKKD